MSKGAFDTSGGKSGAVAHGLGGKTGELVTDHPSTGGEGHETQTDSDFSAGTDGAESCFDSVESAATKKCSDRDSRGTAGGHTDDSSTGQGGGSSEAGTDDSTGSSGYVGEAVAQVASFAEGRLLDRRAEAVLRSFRLLLLLLWRGRFS